MEKEESGFFSELPFVKPNETEAIAPIPTPNRTALLLFFENLKFERRALRRDSSRSLSSLASMIIWFFIFVLERAQRASEVFPILLGLEVPSSDPSLDW
jgi:hypothetical protein